MPRPKIAAPPSPALARRKRVADLNAKQGRRTPAESQELIDLLTAQVAALEADTA